MLTVVGDGCKELKPKKKQVNACIPEGGKVANSKHPGGVTRIVHLKVVSVMEKRGKVRKAAEGRSLLQTGRHLGQPPGRAPVESMGNPADRARGPQGSPPARRAPFTAARSSEGGRPATATCPAG